MSGDVRRLPDGYAARPAERGDLPEVARLLREVDTFDYGESAFGLDFISGDWDRPHFDPTRDAWVVEIDGGIVGYGEALIEGPGIVDAIGLVHPDHRARGIGSLLAAAAERHAVELAALAGSTSILLRTSVATPDHAAHALLSARGYRPVRSFFHMEIDLASDIPAIPNPPEVTLREFAAGRDERAAHATIEGAFAGSWGFHPLTYEQFTERVVGREFEPGLSVMADQDGEPVGVLLGRAMDDLGWVDILAVLQAWRGRGVGAALLRESFVRFRERGLPRAMLNVDAESEAGAVGLYERVGMRVRRRWDLYEKQLA